MVVEFSDGLEGADGAECALLSAGVGAVEGVCCDVDTTQSPFAGAVFMTKN